MYLQNEKYNCEGYPDPTAYLALANIEKQEKIEPRYRPVVYICSPYAGDIERNVENAKRYCRFALQNSAIPLAPHLLFPQFMDDEDPRERALALHMNLVLLSKCAALWVFGDTITKGMRLEIDRAKQKKQTIRYFTSEPKEVVQ